MSNVEKPQVATLTEADPKPPKPPDLLQFYEQFGLTASEEVQGDERGLTGVFQGIKVMNASA